MNKNVRLNQLTIFFNDISKIKQANMKKDFLFFAPENTKIITIISFLSIREKKFFYNNKFYISLNLKEKSIKNSHL